MTLNKWELGKRVFNLHHADGKARPEHYWLQDMGVITKITPQMVEWKQPNASVILGTMATPFSEPSMLAPNTDGFCYYMTELPDMDQYRDGGLYKVPRALLLAHMKTYVGPWAAK